MGGAVWDDGLRTLPRSRAFRYRLLLLLICPKFFSETRFSFTSPHWCICEAGRASTTRSCCDGGGARARCCWQQVAQAKVYLMTPCPRLSKRWRCRRSLAASAARRKRRGAMAGTGAAGRG